MLPLMYLLFMLAAGSTASPLALPCPAPAPIPAPKAAAQAPGRRLNETVVSNSATAPPSAPPSSGSCPPGFKNTVFNTDVAKHAGGLDTIWKSLTANGVSNWIGFSVTPLSQNGIYKTSSGGSAPDLADFNAAQIPMCMDPRDVPAALSMIQSPTPPQYIGLFNEPDFSYGGVTPLTDPITSANSLSKIFSTTTTSTFLSPGLAFTNSDWLTTFRDHCAGCFAKIPIISAHVYSVDQQGAYDQVTKLHATWPDQKIWITELAPASGPGDCSLDSAGVITWMNTLLPRLVELKYVDKVFWNTGSWGPFNGDANKCNPSLTNEDGSATALLEAYGKICT